MKSIQGNLLVCFLALAALVLGGVSIYVYHLTADTLLQQDMETIQLLKERHDQRADTLRVRFDDDLVRKAQKVASRAKLLTGMPLQNHHHFAMAIAANPWSGLQSPLPLLMQMPGHRLADWLGRISSIQVADELLPLTSDSHEIEFCQVHNRRGVVVQKSPTLEGFTLQYPAHELSHLNVFEWDIEDETSPQGQHIRYVVYKTTVPGFIIQPSIPRPQNNLNAPPGFQSMGGGRGGRTMRPAMAPFSDTYPILYIVYGRQTDRLLTELQQLQSEFDHDVENVKAKTQVVLVNLRNRLIMISLLTFGMLGVGIMWLAHWGFLPLTRLRDAVSRVSEKNFKLDIDEHKLPKEIRPIVDKLKETLSSLEQAFVHEKQAVADISHELRTPIASLVTTLQVCLRKPRESEEYRQTLRTCAEIGDHLHHLVQRLLVLARLDAGVDQVQPELIDVGELAESCIDMIRPLAEERSLDVHAHLSHGVLVESDANKLREVIINLLHNAVQYNRDKGRIDLRVKAQGRQAVIEVADNGIGISSEKTKHLFERFYRGDPSRHANEVHAGLGLSIVKGYLQLLGGSIDVLSEEGQGSTFRVTLPLVEMPELAALSPS